MQYSIQYGYAVTSSVKATKIWSIASDWEYLIPKRKDPKQDLLGLVIHRNTGSKETISFLHECCHTLSYKDTLLQNSAWAKMIQLQRTKFTTFRKGVMTHSTIDNNDGRQDTHTGSGTTHDTNKTIFQVPNTLEADTIPVIGGSCMPLDIIDSQDNGSTSSAVHHHALAPVDYYPGGIGPPTIPDYNIIQGDFNEVSVSFKRDIAWSIAGSFVGEDLELLASWTPFNKTVSSYDTLSCNELY